jgi:MoaA/NifB/PqqE/SkfB family radical SAM enzyme
LLAPLYNSIYSGAQYRLRTVGGGRLAAHCRPVSPMLQLTARCNARCLHCDIWKNRGGEETPTVEQWKNLLRDIRNWLGTVHVVFTGGEALLRPYATSLVSHASDLGLLPEVLTHGYWIDQTRIEGLARARPWRITMSLDGLGPVHSKIRGREDFFERSYASLLTLDRIRRQEKLRFSIRFKTVLMAHNLDEVCAVADLAARFGADVFYQPIEQNYNRPEDPDWFTTSENWPKDTAKAVTTVQKLVALKNQGLPVANSFRQLNAMIEYFNDPAGLRTETQNHSAHEPKPVCSSLTDLEIRPSGEVYICSRKPSIGNIRTQPIRMLWANRPSLWQHGCCLLKT